MGFISDLASGRKDPKGDSSPSRNLWEEVFGATDKEERMRTSTPKKPGDVNSYARSLTTEASFKRLLEAMRSRAPGGWSDDRWEQSRHWDGIQYVGGHRICEQMTQSTFKVFTKDPMHPDGKRPVMQSEEGYKVHYLLERPNNDDGWGDICYNWVQQLLQTGMSLTWMVPNKLGQPFEMYSIPTSLAIPQPAVNPDYPEGYYRIQPVYPYGPFSSYPTPASAVGAAIPSQWMLRFKFPHPILRYDGYAPFTALKLHIDEVTSMDRSRWYSMKRSINPSAVLNFDGSDGMTALPEPEIARIHAEWQAQFQGPENSGRLMVGAPGSRLEPWGMRPVDMDYQSGWEQLVSFVLAGMGITKSVAGMIEDTNYSVLWAALKQFHLLTLKPICDRIASKLTRYLAPFYGDDLIIEIECPKIDDHDKAMQECSLLMQGRCLTKNELRKAMNFPTTSEAWGSDMAGDPSPKEIEAQQEQMQVAMEHEQRMAAANDNGQDPEEDAGEDPALAQMEAERPSPGNLGLGALGPRKHLLNGRHKALAGRNGHTKWR